MNFNQTLKRLLIKEPFYGLLCMGMPREFSQTIKTASVCRQGISCKLVINPDFWETLSDDEQLAVLKHELLHICFNHMFMGKYFADHEKFNKAADCEINCYIEGLPDWVEMPEKHGLDNKKGSKYYYENIKSDQNKGNKNTESGSREFDDHSMWKEFDDCGDAEQTIIKDQINHTIKQCAEQVQKSRGTIPSELQDIVSELFKQKNRIFDWKKMFRRMLGTVWDIQVKLSRKKESVRFPNSASIKHKKKVSICVAIDTSGSVSNSELLDFFSEINHIYKAGALIHIVECDAAIHATYEYKGKFAGKIIGRGGTDFQPVIDYYNKHRKDFCNLVYFTDGECSVPENCPRGMMWIITSQGDHSRKFPGKTLYIPKQENQ